MEFEVGAHSDPIVAARIAIRSMPKRFDKIEALTREWQEETVIGNEAEIGKVVRELRDLADRIDRHLREVEHPVG